MSEIADLLATAARVDAKTSGFNVRPRRRIAVVTCMDSRIDVFSLFGLGLGDVHIIRNAGGRVTDDVLRSVALSSKVLGVDSVVLMQHTGCGLEGTTNSELRARTGADLDFLPIDDHAASLQEDAERLHGASYLSTLTEVAGLLYDIDTGAVTQLYHWERQH